MGDAGLRRRRCQTWCRSLSWRPRSPRTQARDQGADLAGQPLGGLLFGISQFLPFAVDAASYAVSFTTLLLLLRAPLQQRRQRPGTRLRTEISEAIAWLWRQRFLRTIALLIGATNFVHIASSSAGYGSGPPRRRRWC